MLLQCISKRWTLRERAFQKVTHALALSNMTLTDKHSTVNKENTISNRYVVSIDFQLLQCTYQWSSPPPTVRAQMGRWGFDICGFQIPHPWGIVSDQILHILCGAEETLAFLYIIISLCCPILSKWYVIAALAEVVVVQAQRSLRREKCQDTSIFQEHI